MPLRSVKTKTALLFYFFCLSCKIFSPELYSEEQDNKKYLLSISTIFKNEAPFLKEWIEYHRLVGVDHFYLYNARSKDDYFSILKPYIRSGIVTLIQWHDLPDHLKEDAATWALAVKIPAHEHAAKYKALKETKWLAFLDIDEFLVPIESDNLTSLLETHDESPGFILKCDSFNASKEQQITRKLLIEADAKINPPAENICNVIEKIIMKPELYESFNWPPYKCNFKGKILAVQLSKQNIRVHRYINRKDEELFTGKRRDKFHFASKNYSEDDVKGILDLGYEVADHECVIHRFIPELLKKLGFDSGWGW